MGKRNVQLASRLAEIILQANNGKTLQLKLRTDEYGMHQRTVRRDIEDWQIAWQIQCFEVSYRILPEMLRCFDVNSAAILPAGEHQRLFPPLDNSILNPISTSTKLICFNHAEVGYDKI